jgi:uncharacterized protein YjbJ (UPF0337 family)
MDLERRGLSLDGRDGLLGFVDTRRGTNMGTAKDKAKVAKGSVKEKVGKATKNRSLEAKGKKDKAVGNLKQAGKKTKKAFK